MSAARRVVDEATIRAWVAAAAAGADEKKANDVVVLGVGDVLAICDWFVIADATNDRQVKAVVEHIEAQVDAEGGPKPLRVEGLDALEWVLMDYGDFVVHVFRTEARAFYDLERLWADVPRFDWRAARA